MATIDYERELFRSVICPACNAQPGRPCTQPTNTGRREVSWVHDAREAAYHEIAAVATGKRERETLRHNAEEFARIQFAADDLAEALAEYGTLNAPAVVFALAGVLSVTGYPSMAQGLVEGIPTDIGRPVRITAGPWAGFQGEVIGEDDARGWVVSINRTDESTILGPSEFVWLDTPNPTRQEA